MSQPVKPMQPNGLADSNCRCIVAPFRQGVNVRSAPNSKQIIDKQRPVCHTVISHTVIK